MSRSLFPAFRIGDVFRRTEEFADERIKRAVEVFTYVGELFVNDARNTRTYKDRTGNLRSSIGYVVLVDGDIAGKDVRSANWDDGGKGTSTAEELIDKLRAEFQRGVVLIGFAGMEYAAAVEAKGRLVITGSATSAQANLKRLINEVVA